MRLCGQDVDIAKKIETAVIVYLTPLTNDLFLSHQIMSQFGIFPAQMPLVSNTQYI